MKKALWAVLSVIILYFAGILTHGAYTDWRPVAGSIPISLDQSAKTTMIQDSVLTAVIWNVGFGGLGAESDFFYDDQGMLYSGSSMVHAPKPLVEKNIAGVIHTLKSTKSDFFLLQEVDVNSDRSYNIPQYQQYREALPDFACTFAANYRCPRVPVPLLEPWNAYGAVNSGLATLSRFQPTETTRHQLPGEYPMPDRMFQLDRCLAVHRYPTFRGKELVVINVHNSAYDPGDKIKAVQLPYLRELAMAEYQKGNYVLIGGDWNQCPPNFRFDVFMPAKSQGYEQGNVPLDFFPEDWIYAYDPVTPTNRKTRDPYQKTETFVTLIDFFLVSPNIKVNWVKTLNQDFQFSDHQAVALEIRI